jgi:hypothetical protein
MGRALGYDYVTALASLRLSSKAARRMYAFDAAGSSEIRRN